MPNRTHIDALNAVLADYFALYMKTKNFHWHVSGPHFRDFHLLLDEQAAEDRARDRGQPADDHADEQADRQQHREAVGRDELDRDGAERPGDAGRLGWRSVTTGAQLIGAGAAISPGNQMRALTANRAKPNSSTMAAGKRVERKNCTGDHQCNPF